MSIATQIERIIAAKTKIRDKLVELGLVTAVAKLDVIATAVEGIANKGAVSASVKEGETYTIPKGYHNGSGTVSGVSGSGNYNLQSKAVTPTKAQQNVVPDEGYYGMSDVTVGAIPEQYQNVSGVTAAAGDVLATKVIVTSDGEVTTGTMVNNGTVSKTLSASDKSYTIPKGYHSGAGNVQITTEEKTATPSESVQNVTPTAGKVLSKVTVNAIPGKFADTSDATAVADDILLGKTAYIYNPTTQKGVKVAGTMANNGTVGGTFDGMVTSSFDIPAGYTSGGTVSLTGDIEAALAAI